MNTRPITTPILTILFRSNSRPTTITTKSWRSSMCI